MWRRVFHSLEPQFCQIGLMIGHNGIMGVGGDVCGTTVLSNRVKDWSPQHTLVGERMCVESSGPISGTSVERLVKGGGELLLSLSSSLSLSI